MHAPTPSIRVVVGKSPANGFMTVHDGDVYLIDDKPAVCKPSSHAWTFYRLKDDGTTDFRSPVDGWSGLDSQAEVVRKINEAFYQ